MSYTDYYLEIPLEIDSTPLAPPPIVPRIREAIPYYLCVSLIVLSIAIPTIYLGFLDTHNNQILSMWVKIAGFSMISHTIVIPICCLLKTMRVLVAFSGLMVLFSLVWIIYGIVLLMIQKTTTISTGVAYIWMFFGCVQHLYIGVVNILIE